MYVFIINFVRKSNYYVFKNLFFDNIIEETALYNKQIKFILI